MSHVIFDVPGSGQWEVRVKKWKDFFTIGREFFAKETVPFYRAVLQINVGIGYLRDAVVYSAEKVKSLDSRAKILSFLAEKSEIISKEVEVYFRVGMIAKVLSSLFSLGELTETLSSKKGVFFDRQTTRKTAEIIHDFARFLYLAGNHWVKEVAFLDLKIPFLEIGILSPIFQGARAFMNGSDVVGDCERLKVGRYFCSKDIEGATSEMKYQVMVDTFIIFFLDFAKHTLAVLAVILAAVCFSYEVIVGTALISSFILTLVTLSALICMIGSSLYNISFATTDIIKKDA